MVAASELYNLERLEKDLADDAARLMSHPIYARLQTMENLRTFMVSHVFAVWDFMSLLKSFQARITCVRIPWVPMMDSSSVRFINEIVLAEESDEISAGFFLSHYELYLRAMIEIGANTEPIQSFVRKISSGASFQDAISDIDLIESTKEFVKTSLEIAKSNLHITAAAFCYGREDIIAPMFRRILDEVESQNGIRYEFLHIYLNRHIEIDGSSHAPLAKKMLANLCGQDSVKWKEALDAAKASVRMRVHLWDGLLCQMH